MTDWYEAALLKALREREDVREEAVRILSAEHVEEEPCLNEIERMVFGERIECPHGCGSMILPGAPACWGCEESLT